MATPADKDLLAFSRELATLASREDVLLLDLGAGIAPATVLTMLGADRIVLVGGRPGRLLHEWTVDIPRNREDHPEAVGALRLAILGALRHAS